MTDFDLRVWAATVALSIAGGLAIYWGVAGYYHVKYYVLRANDPAAWKCQPKRFLRPEQQRQAMLLSSMNLTIGGILSGTLITAIQHGLRTPMYFAIEDRGWAYTIVSTVVLFVLVDGMAYYAHRLLHAKALFRHVHRWHHRYIATSPFVTIAMHPVEFLIFQAVTFLPLFLFPFYAGSIIAVFVYVLAFNIVDHSGVRLQSHLPWQGPTTFHDDHHAHFHCNFGQHLGFWDRMHGTLRRTDRKYGAEVFGGKGAAHSSSEHEKPAEYVKY